MLDQKLVFKRSFLVLVASPDDRPWLVRLDIYYLLCVICVIYGITDKSCGFESWHYLLSIFVIQY